MSNTGSTRQKVFYSFGQLGNGVYNGLNTILTLFASAYTSNPFIIGYLGNTRTIEGVVIQPLIGRMSDRTTNSLGRRRPFILFGIPICAIFLCLIPLAGHAGAGRALPLIFVSVVLFSIFWNIAGDPYKALMVDITNERERSKFNGLLSALALLGQVGIGLYAAKLSKHNIPDALFYVSAAFLLIVFGIVFLGVREPQEARVSAHVEVRIPLRTYLMELTRFREAFKLLMSIFFFWTALNPVQTFLLILPKKLAHASNQQALLVYVVMILSAAICCYPFGRLGSRYGNRRFIIVGMLLLIVAAFLGLRIHSYVWFFPLGILAGVGFAATTSLTFPYLSELVPNSKIGLFAGLETTFSAAAVPFSVLGAGLLIDHFGIRSLFTMLAVLMIVDVAFLFLIDEDAARRQLSEVQEEERRIAGQILPVPLT